jgi:hypothetical protein
MLSLWFPCGLNQGSCHTLHGEPVLPSLSAKSKFCVHLVIYQQQLGLPEVRSWAAPCQGRRYSTAWHVVRPTHYSQIIAPLFQLGRAGRRVGCIFYDLRPLWFELLMGGWCLWERGGRGLELFQLFRKPSYPPGTKRFANGGCESLLCRSTCLFLATPPLEPAPYREMKIQILVGANNSSGIRGTSLSSLGCSPRWKVFVFKPFKTNARNKRSFLPKSCWRSIRSCAIYCTF